MGFAGDEFDEAFGLCGGDGASAGAVGEFGYFVAESFFFGLLFCEADGGDLGLAVGAGGSGGDFVGFLLGVEDAFYGFDGFVGGDVGEPWRAYDVAGGVDGGDVGLVAGVGFDVAFGVEIEFDIGSEEVIEIGDDADGDEEFFCFYCGGSGCGEGEGDVVFLGGDLIGFGLGDDGDVAFGEFFLEVRGDLVVFLWDDPGQGFDEGDLGAEGAVEVGEFYAYGSGSNDDEG